MNRLEDYHTHNELCHHAIGTIEDFSMIDFFTVLPSAWFETKLFFEDYISLSIFFAFIIGIPLLIIFGIKRRLQRKEEISV